MAEIKRIIKNISSYLALIAHSNPLTDRLAREFRFRIWLLSIRLRSKDGLKINKIIWINPNKIEYVSLQLRPNLYIGKLIGGD